MARDLDLSFEAALPKMQQIQIDILAALRAPSVGDGLTCTELAARTGHIIDNVRPAVTGLTKQGLVCETATRRPTQYGRPSIVWALVGGGGS